MKNTVEHLPPNQSTEPAIEKMAPTVIKYYTRLQYFGFAVSIAAGCVFALNYSLAFLAGTELPLWVLNDAQIFLFLGGLVALLITSQYTIDPERECVRYEYENLFYIEKKKISFDEVLCLSIRARTTSWPLLWPWYAMDFRTRMVFKNGVSFELFFDPFAPQVSAGFREAAEAMITRGENLAKVIKCPVIFGPGLRDQPFKVWKEKIDALAQTALKPAEALDGLWNDGMSCLSFDGLGAGVVKIDFPTRLERKLLAGVILVLSLISLLFISSEWQLIMSNPRLLYVLLLDSTSVVATVFALWYLLIDEFLVLDLNHQTLFFRSRILWKKKDSPVGAVAEAKMCALGNQPYRALVFDPVEPNAQEYNSILVLQENHQIKTSVWVGTRDFPHYRSWAMSQLLGCPLSEEPLESENNRRISSPEPNIPEGQRHLSAGKKGRRRYRSTPRR